MPTGSKSAATLRIHSTKKGLLMAFSLFQNCVRLLLVLGVSLRLQAQDAVTANANPAGNVRTIFIAGDSTAANGMPGAVGWGKYLASFFDSQKLNVQNLARGGRSSRTFLSEGLWEALLQRVQPGDIVLIQFGHNDGGSIDAAPARGSLAGIGDDTKQIENPTTKRSEVVHTFGWNVKKMIMEVKEKQAFPIVLSITVRNIWSPAGSVERGSGQGRFGNWSREVARSEKVPFLDMTKVIADRYEMLGTEAVQEFFPRDHTHTNDAGAKLNAELTVAALKGLRDQVIIECLNVAGRMVAKTDPDNVVVGQRIGPRQALDPAGFPRWLNVPLAADPRLPSLYLIGDSTVRTGRGDGDNGQFGWGDPIEEYFDLTKLNVVNRALGGTGAGTFRTLGTWDNVLASLKAGDVVITQFGHNDNGTKGALRGIGDETVEREDPTTKQMTTVHTFGWYLRQYIHEVRAKGATPILCSLIPRNNWRDGKIVRTQDSHADWARSVAASEKADFIDLHELIAERYEALGAEAVMPLFADQRVHTNWQGAVFNAKCVIEGLNRLSPNPLARFYKTNDLISKK